MKKKTSFWSTVLIIVVQVAIASISFYVPLVNIWLKSLSVGELLIGYLSFETAIIASALIWSNYTESEQRRAFEESVVKRLDIIPYTRWLNINEFYNIFLSELAGSKIRVNICYMGPIPPTLDTSKQVRDYYKESIATIKRRATEPVYYRRIVRLTKSNWTWIKELCDQLSGSKASIAVLEDSGDELRNTLAVSVQTVDGERVYLTALTEKEDFVTNREVLIASQSICKGFDVYYDRLWSRSVVVLAEGRKNQNNITAIEAKISN